MGESKTWRQRPRDDAVTLDREVIEVASGQVGVFAVWVAAVVVNTTLVFAVAPALARTIFRSRLDEIRDEIMDAVLAGGLTMAEPVEEFLQGLKVQNRIARRLTLLRVAAIVLELRRIGVDFGRSSAASFAQLEPHERKLLHAFAKRVNHALSAYLMWGSPLGWVAAPLVYLARILQRRQRQRPRHTPLDLDLEQVAQDFNRAGAYNELTSRPRLLQRAA